MASPKIVAKYPVKVKLEKDKLYHFCTCGYSSKHPFCDGTHREEAPDMKSHPFEIKEDGEFYLCQCKATKNVPFCDGTHNDL